MSDLSQLHSDKKIYSIGDELRTRREELQLSLEEASQRLRIRLVFLKALEDGRIDQLPGVAYASGFLRLYAELLELDSDALVKQFRDENQANNEKPKLMFPAPVPRSGIPAGVVVFFSLLIMVGAYIGWYKMSDHQQSPPETIPPPPAQIDQNTGTSQQVSPQIASIMPSSHPAPLSEDNKPVDVSTIPSVTGANLQPAVPQPSVPATENTNTPPAESKEPEQPLMVKAIAPSWLQIKDKEGHVLYQKVLKTDETWQIPSDKDEIVMTIGNPGVIVLQKGEIQSSPLGKKGRALRRFVLNASKAEKLLHPTDEGTEHSAPLSSDASIPQEKKKKPVVTQPTSTLKHDSSADELNARQLNH